MYTETHKLKQALIKDKPVDPHHTVRKLDSDKLDARIVANKEAIDQEVLDRTLGDALLDDRIDTVENNLIIETTERETADNEIRDDLSELDDRVLDNTQQISDEISDRIEAVDGLEDLIEDLEDDLATHTHPEAVPDGASGFLSGDDKAKLDTVQTGAEVNPTGAEIANAYESEDDRNAFTDAEKSKLAGIEGSKFLGTYISLMALESAHASPAEGSYAHVDAGVGDDVLVYIWDNSDEQYVAQTGTGTEETAASIKTKYESNADTNAYTNAEKAKVGNLPADTEEELDGKSDVGHVHAAAEAGGSSGFLTGTDKLKLDNVPADTTSELADKVDEDDFDVLVTRVEDTESDISDLEDDVSQNTYDIGELELVNDAMWFELTGKAPVSHTHGPEGLDEGAVTASKLLARYGGQIYPDPDLLDDEFYDLSGAPNSAITGTGVGYNGLRQLRITGGGTVYSRAFPLKPSTTYQLEGVCRGGGEESHYVGVQVGSVASNGTVTWGSMTVLLVGDVNEKRTAEFTTASTARRARLVFESTYMLDVYFSSFYIYEITGIRSLGKHQIRLADPTNLAGNGEFVNFDEWSGAHSYAGYRAEGYDPETDRGYVLGPAELHVVPATSSSIYSHRITPLVPGDEIILNFEACHTPETGTGDLMLRYAVNSYETLETGASNYLYAATLDLVVGSNLSSTWQQYSVSRVITGEGVFAGRAQIRVDGAVDSGAIKVRNFRVSRLKGNEDLKALSITPRVVSTVDDVGNLCTNGLALHGLDTWLQVRSTSAQWSMSVNDSETEDGLPSFQFHRHSGGSSAFATPAIKVRPFETFQFSFNVRCASSTAGGFYVHIWERSNPPPVDGLYIGYNDRDSFTNLEQPSLTAEWLRRTYTYTVPDGVNWIQFSPTFLTTAADDVFLNNISIRRAGANYTTHNLPIDYDRDLGSGWISYPAPEITTGGRPVLCVAHIYTFQDPADCTFRLRRSTNGGSPVTLTESTNALTYIDTPPAGVQEYEIEINNQGSTSTLVSASLSVVEL